MAHPTHKISGRVFDLNTGNPVPNAEVEAWDYDLGLDDALGKATTDADGKFKIAFHFADF